MCKNKSEFDQLVAEYRTFATMKKKAEERLKKVKPDMEEYIRAKGIPSGKDGKSLVIFGDGYKVTLSESDRTTFNGDLLKELLGDSVAEYQNVTLVTKIDVR